MARTGYPLISLSIWPFTFSVSLFLSIFFGVNFLHGNEPFFLWLFSSLMILTLGNWWADVIYEGAFQNQHSKLMRSLYRLAFKMFIVSESFFFISFFWAWFYYGIGEISQNHLWPPRGITPMSPFMEPGLNLALLLSSGATANAAQNAIFYHNTAWCTYLEKHTPEQTSNFWEEETGESAKMETEASNFLLITIFLGSAFLAIQYNEYHMLPYSICNSTFGSCFFILTGFHASHVIAGLVMLTSVWIRLKLRHFSFKNDTWFVQVTMWYWHFVDVIWIFVLAFVYIWCY